MCLVDSWKVDNVDSSRFGDLEEVPPMTFSTVNEIDRLATFVFRYRPLGGLLTISIFQVV
jgi:hypothetical protein